MSNKQETLYGLGVIALVLQITSICTEEWSISNTSLFKRRMGLWRLCKSESGKTNCVHLPPNPTGKFPKNSLYASRIFSVLGVVFVAVSLAMMWKMPKKMAWHFWLLLLGGLYSILAMIIWAVEMLHVEGVKYKPGYSFHLQWIGGVIAVGASIYHGYYK